MSLAVDESGDDEVEAVQLPDGDLVESNVAAGERASREGKSCQHFTIDHQVVPVSLHLGTRLDDPQLPFSHDSFNVLRTLQLSLQCCTHPPYANS